jgi:hypothetical protein
MTNPNLPLIEKYIHDAMDLCDVEMEECPVCLEQYPSADSAVHPAFVDMHRLPCRHSLCIRCYAQILETSCPSCPMCRATIVESPALATHAPALPVPTPSAPESQATHTPALPDPTPFCSGSQAAHSATFLPHTCVYPGFTFSPWPVGLGSHSQHPLSMSITICSGSHMTTIFM